MVNLQNKDYDYQDVKMCNCAACGIELLGRSMREWHRALKASDKMQLPPMVHDRIDERPYCGPCFRRIMTGLRVKQEMEN